MKVKRSFISKLLRSLNEKGFLLTLKISKTKILNLSLTSYAQNFKKLYESRPDARIEAWLSGKSIEILILASQNEEGIPVNLLEKEAGCSKPTIYKILNALYSTGVAAKNNNTIKITDPIVRNFANSYADGIQLIIQSKVKGVNTSIRVRKHVILRTSSAEVPEYFSKTGINALVEYGLEANLTSYGDFYFNLDQEARKPSIEESFIHALLLTTIQQFQDMPLLALFYKKNRERMNPIELRELAKIYAVVPELDELRTTIGYHDKLREFE
jgi:predicted transcriptional regulator